MLVVMFLAFRGARVANRGAEDAEFRTKFGISAHERRPRPTEIRAINTRSGAFRHVPQTLISAAFAFLSTAHAGVDT